MAKDIEQQCNVRKSQNNFSDQSYVHQKTNHKNEYINTYKPLEGIMKGNINKTQQNPTYNAKINIPKTNISYSNPTNPNHHPQ